MGEQHADEQNTAEQDTGERRPGGSGADPNALVAGLACASLVDAMGRLYGHRAHILSLVSPTPERILFGPAVTIAYLPHRDDRTETNELGFGGWFYRAVADAARGSVLVLSSGGYPDASHGGGTKLSRLHNHGLAGVLTDSRLRDFGELAGYDFSTWCAGEATHWGGGTVTPSAANVPVEVGGVCVIPGDYVFADRSGAVVIPARGLSDVIAQARRVDADDARSLSEIRAEDPERMRTGDQRATEQ
ncbi:RraA family protein [Streptomyces odontomachi]|uniref:RraA family protein n=1 Tax=Streptomyces odontomachi TaxID=2944940 RepID=UPI00210B3151|nr:RraA family protein [Streptomyces sp. ODS25]